MTCGSFIRSLCVAATVALLAQAALAPPAEADSMPGALNGQSAAQLPVADRIVVFKRERRLELWQGVDVLRRYRISLGLNPVGHKEREGDFRTPEGRYRLVRRNSRSDYFLSLQVSYPNESDRRNARRLGVRPGGSIMIHGLPNDPRYAPDYYSRQDWTDGCIALSNADMLEVWLLVPDNIPIEILP
ncbi:MAG: L,D-transpeptidase family protein [Steroidobacteraceae bacterium]